MTIFPHNQPKLTKADVHRLAPYLGNSRVPLAAWLKTNPSLQDLKLAVMVEVERARMQPAPLKSLGRGVLAALLKRIAQLELSIIDDNIRKELMKGGKE